MIPLGSTATNPQTGHRIVLTEKGWVDAGSPQMAATVSPQDQQGITQLTEDASQSSWLAQKAREFKAIQNGHGSGDTTGTGLQYHDLRIPLPVLDKVDLNPVSAFAAAVNPRIGDMESVTNQAWAHMRPTGSGVMRMPEIEGFQQSFPNIENSPQTNTDITSRLNQDASLAAQKLRFIDDYIRQNRGTYADANAAYETALQGPGNGSVIYGAGSPQQGQPVTQGQQTYALSAPASGPTGGPQNPYYDTPQGQAPDGSYHVTQSGQYMAPPGQMNMQAGQQPQAAPVLTWNPQTGGFQ